MDEKITLTVNGEEKTISFDPNRSLLDVLREDLLLTGAKYGCGEGRCGACTVLMDGSPVLSCILPAVEARDRSITTIEGLATEGALHPIQEAFLAEGAMQCGYCTPGMILSAKALLDKNPDPTDQDILDGMNSHICRCCGYTKITAAIRRAAKSD